MLGGEPRVVGHAHAAIKGPLLREVVGNAAGTAANVVEGEVLGDGGTPAIGAEADRGHGQGYGSRLPAVPSAYDTHRTGTRGSGT
jgi:hypothetical protein